MHQKEISKCNKPDQEVKDLNVEKYKILIKEIKENSKKWKVVSHALGLKELMLSSGSIIQSNLIDLMYLYQITHEIYFTRLE